MPTALEKLKAQMAAAAKTPRAKRAARRAQDRAEENAAILRRLNRNKPTMARA